MKQAILFILLLISFGTIASESVAQEAYTYVSNDSITVGDRFGLIIVVPKPDAATIARPIFSAPAGASALRFGDLVVFKSLSSGQLPLSAGSDFSFADTLVYEATTFAIDSAFVPPLRLRLVVGPDTSFVTTTGFHFPVVSLVEESMDDILDLSEIAGFPPALWPWFLLAGILLATFLIVKFKDRFVRAPEAIVEEEPEVEPDPPFEEAMKRLGALEKAPFVDTEVKVFFVELTAIVRLYFSRRIDLPALESTSSELLSDLSNWTAKQNYDQPPSDADPSANLWQIWSFDFHQ